MRIIEMRKRASLRRAGGVIADVRRAGATGSAGAVADAEGEQTIKRPAFLAMNLPVNVSNVGAKVNTGLSRRASIALRRKRSSNIAGKRDRCRRWNRQRGIVSVSVSESVYVCVSMYASMYVSMYVCVCVCVCVCV